MNRREFIGGVAATVAVSALGEETKPTGIRLRFLGTGAAGVWKGAPRRQSSVLLENRTLIDFTACNLDMLPEGCRPDTILYTHSHGDHYDPFAALKLGVKRVYAHETWANCARRHFAKFGEKLGLPPPEVVALRFGEPVTVNGLVFTSLPANHCTDRVTDGVLERTSFYLVEKGSARLLYATDTAGIPGEAARYIGIDAHISEKRQVEPPIHRAQAITAFVMEATMARGLEEDFRLYVHSSVDTVERTVKVLTKTGRYLPPPGQSVYITHMGVGYPDSADEIDKTLPAPLKAARDGLEVVLG